MFTGIVDHCGQIIDIQSTDNHCTLTIKSNFDALTLGESIALDGACLTVTEYEEGVFTVALSPETMKLTTAAFYQVGTNLNLERSLRLMDRLGGHFVTGHIDGICKVASITTQNKFIEIQFEDSNFLHRKYLVKKGSVAINGVSLTVNEVTPTGFVVMLIPHTLEKTTFSTLQVNDCVNVEYDYIAKLIFNQIKVNVYE